jgi:hypothetical protein
MNGKQLRVRRPPSIDGLNAEEFILQNADPIWLHQNGYHEILHNKEMKKEKETTGEATDDSDLFLLENERTMD